MIGKAQGAVRRAMSTTRKSGQRRLWRRARCKRRFRETVGRHPVRYVSGRTSRELPPIVIRRLEFHRDVSPGGAARRAGSDSVAATRGDDHEKATFRAGRDGDSHHNDDRTGGLRRHVPPRNGYRDRGWCRRRRRCGPDGRQCVGHRWRCRRRRGCRQSGREIGGSSKGRESARARVVTAKRARIPVWRGVRTECRHFF